MNGSEWNDDEPYDPAPLPPHERVWRHPSEVGEQSWKMSEPPIAIGRGLTVATGTFGCLLALVVLWTMLPTQAGGSADSAVRSTLSTRSDSGLIGSNDTTGATGTNSAAVTTTGASASSSTQVVAGPPQSTVTASTLKPMPTYQVHQGSERTVVAIAVAVNGGGLVVTTAQAVAADHTVDLLMPDGSLATARVLFVDDRSGLALLAPEAADAAAAYVVASAILAGDELTFSGDVAHVVTVAADLTIDPAWSLDETIIEGSPVVNQRGELVALCSKGDKGPRLVHLRSLDQLQQAIARYQGTSKVWLGVILNDDPAGKLSIGAVDPAGPAARAGLTSGDEIVSIDGTALSSAADLTAALATRAPDDVVSFLVRRVDGTEVTVSITLGAAKTSL